MGKISRQSGVFFAGTLFSVASAYFFKIYLARVLGAEGLGLYALGITLVGFLGVFNALGLPQAAVRFVSVYTARQLDDAIAARAIDAAMAAGGAGLELNGGVLGLLAVRRGGSVTQQAPAGYRWPAQSGADSDR